MPELSDSIMPRPVPPISTAPQMPSPHALPHAVPADSVAGPTEYPSPFSPVLDTLRLEQLQEAGLYAPADTVATQPPAPPAWESGIEGEVKEKLSGSDSGLLTVLTLIFVALALNFRHCPRIFANFTGELLSVRRRANVFDEHTTNETRVLILLILQYIAYLGILIYALIDLLHPLGNEHIFRTTATLMGVAGGYYVFQICAYNLVGYMFSTPEGRRQWLRGFNASQSLAGLALMIPALITIFYPYAAAPALTVAGSLYLIARLVFITKGFRIFFTRITSLVYFILYLCTLEIIPVIILYRISLYLANHSPQ